MSNQRTAAATKKREKKKNENVFLLNDKIRLKSLIFMFRFTRRTFSIDMSQRYRRMG